MVALTGFGGGLELSARAGSKRPSAYAGAWDADGAPAVSEENESGGATPADHGGSEAPAESGSAMYVVNCSEYVNLRAAPDTASQVLAHIPLGEQVLAYGGEGDFYRVEYAGMRGYVHADYLSSERASFSMRLAADPGYAAAGYFPLSKPTPPAK